MEKVGFQRSFEGSWKEVQGGVGRGVEESQLNKPSVDHELDEHLRSISMTISKHTAP